MRSVTVNQKTQTDAHLALHSRRYGDSAAPKLLILHGLFGSGANWRSVAMRFAGDYEVFCLDLRNHGQSPWHGRMDYSVMAGDVARFMDANDLRGAALLGHSMGGKVAMTLAQGAHTAGAVGKLIVVDIAPVAYSPERMLPIVDAMLAVDLSRLGGRGQLDAALSAAGVADSATRQFLAQNLVKRGNANTNAWAWRLNLPVIRQHLADLSGYDNARVSAADALFIAGGESDYLPAAAHAAIYARFPAARIETIAGAGHWLHAEQPERLVGLCNDFLAG